MWMHVWYVMGWECIEACVYVRWCERVCLFANTSQVKVWEGVTVCACIVVCLTACCHVCTQVGEERDVGVNGCCYPVPREPMDFQGEKPDQHPTFFLYFPNPTFDLLSLISSMFCLEKSNGKTWDCSYKLSQFCLFSGGQNAFQASVIPQSKCRVCQVVFDISCEPVSVWPLPKSL